MERFRFVTTPFTREMRVEQRFKVDFVESGIKSLLQIAESRQSAVLIGPAGAGKSVILRALVASLPETRYRIVYLKHANLGARDMCRQIALGLGLPSVGSFPSLVRVLEERLHTGFQANGLRQILIFDDAHEIRTEALRLLRVLTNFEMDSKLVVSLFLAGQLPLKRILMNTELEDIRHRLNACFELRLLSKDETVSYIDHRIKLAGVQISPFSADACEALFEISQGNMRAIDKIAQASLRLVNESGRTTISASDVAIARTTQWM